MKDNHLFTSQVTSQLELATRSSIPFHQTQSITYYVELVTNLIKSPRYLPYLFSFDRDFPTAINTYLQKLHLIYRIPLFYVNK